MMILPQESHKSPALSEPLLLGDGNLDIQQLEQLAQGQRELTISRQAWARVTAGSQIVLQALRSGQHVYGLTLGVGWNKDRGVGLPTQGSETELMTLSCLHNHDSLRAHAAGFGPPLAPSIVRAAMVVRLNMMLTGCSGVQPAVVEQLRQFLRCGITPVVPSKGSVGMGDITQNAHIGLALIGEWEVDYQDQTMSASEALALTGLSPLHLQGKDFLGIISSNSLTAGRLGLAVNRTAQLLERLQPLFALALEAMNCNLSPMLAVVTAAKPDQAMQAAAARLRLLLDGSDLWRQDPARQLQDPLSFRDIAYTLGRVQESLDQARDVVCLHINHSDDNPLVCIDPPPSNEPLDAAGLVRDQSGNVLGAIYPSANYDGQALAIATEQLCLALARLSNVMTMQVYRTEMPALTGLSRFLAHPVNPGHAFGALQKPMLALDRENVQLAQPVTLGHSVMAGTIEDVAMFGPQAVAQLEQLVDNLYEMASLHLLHMAQAVDLRNSFSQAPATAKFLHAYRQFVPLVIENRIFTRDIQAGVKFLQI